MLFWAFQVLGASIVETPATSIDGATVQLLMVGKLADYTASKLESMKFDLAAVARISPSAISFNVVSTGADVVLSATMPAAAAAEVVAKHADNSFTSLGSQQVQTTAAGRSHVTALQFGPSCSELSAPVGRRDLRLFRAGLGCESRANDRALCSDVPRQAVDCSGHRR